VPAVRLQRADAQCGPASGPPGARQAARYRGKRWISNADLPPRAVREHCALAERAVRTLGLSMRAHLRVLRVARTLADLVASDAITPTHLAEALAWRLFDGTRAARG
jgi:magnesium chelatase family protein